ncbi:MAG: tetratricopeptide repeat protein [Chitinophagaceae bacterium]
MRIVRSGSFLFLFLVAFTVIHAQQAAAVDSMKRVLAVTKTTEEKVYWLDILSKTLMNVNLAESDKYGQQLIEIAEESRDRKLMVTAYLSNGTRCSYFATQKEYLNRAIGYYDQALGIARQNRMDEETGKALLKLGHIHLAIPDKDKALSYINQAFSIISTLNNDSLRAEAHNHFGDLYLVRNDKILSLRHYLTGLRLGEEIKNASLIRDANINLAGFYASIGDYDRAIDHYIKAMSQLDRIDGRNGPYQRAMDLNSIGNLYSQKKNYDLAISHFNRSLALADSLKFSTLKVPAYVSLLNQYLRMDKPAEALAFFNSAAGQNLQQFLSDFGMAGVISQAYGVIYTELGRYDSAKYYLGKAAPFFENSTNDGSRLNYYAQLASLYNKTGEYTKAIDLYLKVKEIAEKNGQLESVEKASRQLDSLYTKTGDFRMAMQYNAIHYQYKDSIEKLNKEKELAQVEAADEQLRQQRLDREKAEAKRKRFQLQYIAITIGIASFFVALVMLGMFKVSKYTIRMIGFFTFIMFFEFIFLIFKKNIASFTEGEPWKDLLFMIGLAAILLPLHHWLEHRVIHYLTSHNRLTEAGQQLRMRLFRRKTGNS